MSLYDTSTSTNAGLTRTHRQAHDSHWFIKLLALVILLLCAAIGMALAQQCHVRAVHGQE